MKIYCVSFKNGTENKNPIVFKTKNGRLMLIKNEDLIVKLKDLVSYHL